RGLEAKLGDPPPPRTGSAAPYAGRARRWAVARRDRRSRRSARRAAGPGRPCHRPRRAPHGSRHGGIGPHHRARLRPGHCRRCAGGRASRSRRDRGILRRHGVSALTLSGLRRSSGAVVVLPAVAVEVRPGGLGVWVGGNCEGKTTLLKTIAGVLRPTAGRISTNGLDITGRPSWWVARHGIALVPEGRGVFGDQSVRDNLRLGALARASGRDAGTLRSD